ncbi:serine/threonine-protein kinase [Sorangium sp. So ce131]|uniref:serine/threonine-protein kinase n=1 Tax=Sorangium sp. So ce131 TaxID=3133282 RepID=UPI003F5E4BC5
MSEVYEGRETLSGRPVAVKVLRDIFCLDADTLSRFLNEARVLEGIQHSHVVAVLAWGRLPAGPPYMILEWLPVSLQAVLAGARVGLLAGVAARVAAQIAEGLSSLHERDIVHRDLKPANVLSDDGDPTTARYKLADLGLAKVRPGPGGERARQGADALLPVSTSGEALLGTWDYMAPEQWLKSKDVGPKADVYSLGVLLFQMLTGQLPFIARDQEALMCLHLFEQPPLALLDGVVSEERRDLVARMLSKKPSQRPAMREVLALLVRSS